MKLTPPSGRARARQRGWALLAVMALAACALMLLAGVMNWANQNSANAERNNEYFAAAYAAESATEKVLASMSLQYQSYGFNLINANMSGYPSLIPNSSDGSYWTNYQFSGGHTAGSIIVSNSATAVTNVLGPPYAGLTFVGNTYQIIANAQLIGSLYNIVATVGQEINFGTIPLFQFAIFYQNDMEVEPGAAMTVTGLVHGNANVYLYPGSTLTFASTLSSVGSISTNESPLDLRSPGSFGIVTNQTPDQTGVDPLNLPVGTNTTGVNNTLTNAYGILIPPAAGQTPNSAGGTNLLYNKADMIIIISNNNTIAVTSGAGINGQTTIISNSQWQSFLSTNGTFVDQRDNSLPVNQVVLNVSNLVKWSSTNTTLSTALSGVRPGQGNVQSIYVADFRSTSNATYTTNAGTNFSTNSTTTVSYPAAGTYSGSVTTNTTPTTNASTPAGGTYTGSVTPITTPTTTTSKPGSGTYTGSVATNTALTTTVSKPSAGTYTGSITTNKNNGVITGYTYQLITNYTYNLITGYSYNLITGYTYNAITGTPWSTTTTTWTTVSQPGIVLSNGAALPPQGLSIATPDPVYIVGNWNTQLTNKSGASSDAGQNVTTYSLPSAIFADAITVLSPSWNPANSSAGIGSRKASSDTVNAAFLMGNVPSSGVDSGPGHGYSGGVENFPRFLEDWGGQTFTYNGSMVQMFTSQIANYPWPNTSVVYNPPTRNWAFDQNFNNPALQPPMTPQIITVQRSQWALLQPYATTMTNISFY
jgi:hypothetical protein